MYCVSGFNQYRLHIRGGQAGGVWRGEEVAEALLGQMPVLVVVECLSRQLAEEAGMMAAVMKPARNRRLLSSVSDSGGCSPSHPTDSDWMCSTMDSEDWVDLRYKETDRKRVNEDEQGPEEHSDDSGPNEDYNLHVGLVT
ncbi:hypothetical protein INR49_024849 [Caranx melampygus]|nr:hypothetical protein INR49_024849 [Caranx melampygus]